MMNTQFRRTLLTIMLALVVACGTNTEGDDTPEQDYFGPPEREARLRVPPSYDHATPTPLIIVLHGYGVTSAIQIAFSRLDTVGALVLGPEGTINERDKQFWNATDECCDFFDTGVDDVAYLGGLLDDVRSVYNVDPKRIFLWGHSNGGFMAYRMACERASDIAGIVSVAGATFTDGMDCNPSEPVSILQIHGTDDDVVLYEGGETLLEWTAVYPSVDTTLGFWAGYNGCASARTIDSTAVDLDHTLSGAETTIERADNCPPGIDVELWRIAGGTHVPAFRDTVGDQFWDWMQTHAKP